MNTATEQVETLETETEELSPEGFLGGDDDDEELVGWFVKLLSDGEQIVVPHPEGKTRSEVMQEFAKAKAKKHQVFVLGRVAFDPEDVSVFGWSKDVQLPEVDKFDSIQERLEFCADALADLTRQQAALQQAHAELAMSEFEELQAEREDVTQGRQPEEPEVLDADVPIDAKPAHASRKGGFRPPGA